MGHVSEYSGQMMDFLMDIFTNTFYEAFFFCVKYEYLQETEVETMHFKKTKPTSAVRHGPIPFCKTCLRDLGP